MKYFKVYFPISFFLMFHLPWKEVKRKIKKVEKLFEVSKEESVLWLHQMVTYTKY